MAQGAAARGSTPLVQKWEAKLGIEIAGYFLQRMKTKWGGCNRRAGNIRLNTELVKKPKDLLEYGPAPVPWTGTDLGFKRSAATVSSRS